MKMDFLRKLALGAVLALLAPLGFVQAQDVQLASHTELSDLYARLAELESRVAATNMNGGGCADGVHGCGDCYDDCCCDGCPGFVGGIEVLWLKAFQSGGDFGDFNYDEAFRIWAGYQGAGGLGARIRYFDYEDVAVNGDSIDIEATDFEIFDAVQLGCNWDLNIGGGLRYLDRFTDNGNGEDSIAGVGPILSAELYRHVSDRAALYAITRQSIIVGDGAVAGVPAEDLTCYISEIQLGGQLHREYRGGLLFARVGWEAQWIHEPESNDESVTLMGIAFGVGLMR
jgi:hypothetical protein